MESGHDRLAREQLLLLDLNQMTHANDVAAVMFPPSS